MTLTNKLVSVILAYFLGIFGIALIFSDLTPGESWSSRVLIAVLYFFLCGLGLGFFSPKMWIISVLPAWGGILLGGFIVLTAINKHGSSAFGAQEPPYISAGLVMFLIPLTLAFIGGYTGKQFNQMRRGWVRH